MDQRDAFVKWIEREGFTLDPNSTHTWVRPCKFYLAPNLKSEKPMFGVFSYDEGDTVDLFIMGPGKKFGFEVWVRDVPITSLQSIARGFENRMADAWNDLNS